MSNDRFVFSAVVFCLVLAGGLCHPGRPAFTDNLQARMIFEVAERNRTNDGYITADELKDIVATFDLNHDGQIILDEFLYIWEDRHLGDLLLAKNFYRNLDTDHDGVVSESPDMFRVFYYFDSDHDGKISQQEFVIVWISMGLS